ncbi:MAG: 2-phospho-L-lactate guanylyltransferase [Kiloniellaceae bacterium]
MTGRATWAVVPVKRLDAAKHRLADVLAPAERRALARAMLEDVLGALGAARGLAGIAVVSADRDVICLTRKFGARVLAETGPPDLNAAVRGAARVLAAKGCAPMLVVPADVPLVTAAEIQRILAAHQGAPAVTLVPARDGEGTNGLACSPPDVIAPCFGEDSLARHLEAARRRGIAPTVVRLSGLGLDVDTPADLRALLARPPRTRSHAVLAVGAASAGGWG